MGSSPSRAQTKVTAVSRINVSPRLDTVDNTKTSDSANHATPKPPSAPKPPAVKDPPPGGRSPNTNPSSATESSLKPASVPNPPAINNPPPGGSSTDAKPSLATETTPITPTVAPKQYAPIPSAPPLRGHVTIQNTKPEAYHESVFGNYKVKVAASKEVLEKDEFNEHKQAQLIDDTNTIFFQMSQFPDWVDKHHQIVCNYIKETEFIIQTICKTIIQQKDKLLTSYLATPALLVIVNLTDQSPDLSIATCAVPGFLDMIYEFCDDNKDAASSGYLRSALQGLITRVLMIVHNVAMTDANIPILQEKQFVPVLRPYLTFPNDTIKMTAILAMADIMTEEESDELNANTDVMIFLLKVFSVSVSNKKHQAKDGSGMIWSSLELTKGIGRLARNDGNKTMLVKLKCLPPLLKLAKEGDATEQHESLKALWALAFSKENQDTMIKEPGLIKFVDEKNKNGSPEIRHVCNGILWTMRTKLLESSEFKSIGQRLAVKRAMSAAAKKKKKKQTFGRFNVEEDEEEKDDENKGHIMISYQWADQKILTQIRDKLRNDKMKVWMDIDDMEGSTLQAMAEAIENAEVVLICMSRKYKDSPNCRAEAEYAHQLRKKVIPLIMERGYRPDGWLGMILGAKLFYDFSGKYPFEQKFEALLKEVKVKASGDKNESTSAAPVTYDQVDAPEEVIVPISQPLLYAPSRPPPQKLTNVKTWSKNQVKDWLSKHKIQGSFVDKLTGKEVAFLQKIQTVAPDFYFQTVQNDLSIKGLANMANFEAAMDDLP